ncbi:MAG: ABC transporter substrate-binding protein [Pyrinomonadaceae bacterium]
MKKIITSVLTLALFAPFAACVQKGGETGSTGDGTGVIKIGVYGDLSGQTSNFGKSTRQGVELATEEVNAKGGIGGRKIQLVVEDDQGRPEQAKTVVSKLINQDKVSAVIGEVASTNSLAAAPVAQEARVPMITPSSTNPKVTQVGDYIFRVCFIDPFQGSVMAKFAANSLKAKTAAIFGDVNSDYSKGLTEFFEGEFTKLGSKVIMKQSYTQNDQDYKGQLTAIRSANPDVIYVPGYYGQVGIIAKQARELGMNQPILGGDGWDSAELWALGGAAMKNTFISNHYSVDDPSPAIQTFVKAYKAKFNNVAPDAIAALAYDAMNILAASIQKAGGTDSAKLRDSIAATSAFPGVTGNITLDKDRNAIKPAVVLELNPAEKKYIYKETIAVDGAPSNTATTGANMNANTMSSQANANMANTAPTNTNMASNANAAANVNGNANAAGTK